MSLPWPNLRATVKMVTAPEVSIDGLPLFEVEVTADAVAAFVWLEVASDGFWSENGFVMVEQVAKVMFHSRSALLTADQLQRELKLTSLFDTSPEYGQNNGWPKSDALLI